MRRILIHTTDLDAVHAQQRSCINVLTWTTRNAADDTLGALPAAKRLLETGCNMPGPFVQYFVEAK